MSATAGIRSSQIADIVGASNLISDPGLLRAYEVDGLLPPAAARPGSMEEIVELIRVAGAEKLAVIPVGAGTKLRIGMPPERYDLVIDMTRLDRIISYDPGDLTLSVEAGIGIAALLKQLAAHGQFLPLVVPFIDRATIGGTLASGLDSPLRNFFGMPRDYVLGMEFVTGDGAQGKSGGRVVKNVTGYDLHKLLLGSLGTLGIITRVNFKTFPQPRGTRTWLSAFQKPEAAFAMSRKIAKSPLTPHAVEIIGRWSALPLYAGASETKTMPRWQVAVAVSGDDAVLRRYTRELELISESCSADSMLILTDDQEETLWDRVCEFPRIICEECPDATILKIGLVPTELPEFVKSVEEIGTKYGIGRALLSRAVGVIRVALLPTGDIGHTLKPIAQACYEIMHAATAAGGHGMIEWCPKELKREVNVWGDTRDSFPLMQKLKCVFDPHRTLSPGRFVGGL